MWSVFKIFGLLLVAGSSVEFRVENSGYGSQDLCPYKYVTAPERWTGTWLVTNLMNNLKTLIDLELNFSLCHSWIFPRFTYLPLQGLRCASLCWSGFLPPFLWTGTVLFSSPKNFGAGGIKFFTDTGNTVDVLLMRAWYGHENYVLPDTGTRSLC